MPRASRRRRLHKARRKHRREQLARQHNLCQCWCGTVEELFDEYVYDQTCDGSGHLDCYCGGDFCVCHHHGSAECPGCSECEGGPRDDDFYDDEDY